MADNQKDFQSFIYPFALGCLDKDEFVSMVDYIEAGGDFPWQELGELQNLTALLPSFLNIETPDPAVKDQVARTLYKLKAGKPQEQKPIPPKPMTVQKTGIYQPDTPPAPPAGRVQIRVAPSPGQPLPASSGGSEVESSQAAQRSGEASRPAQTTQVRRRINQTVPERTPFSEEKAGSPGSAGDLHLNLAEVSEETAKSEFSFHLPEKPEAGSEPATETFIINTSEGGANNTVPLSLQSNGSISTGEQSVSDSGSSASETVKDKPVIIQKKGGAAFYIMSLLLAGGCGYMYYTCANKAAELDMNAKSFKESVTEQINNAVFEDRDLSMLLSKKDVSVYQLSGMPKYKESYGRIIWSNEEQRGYLQLGLMPEIKPSEQKGYVAWVVVGGRSIALNSVPVSGANKFEFIQIFGMPDISQDPQTEFLVTKEAISGIKLPGSNLILRGEFINPKQN